MKLLIVLTLFGLSVAELTTYAEFKANSVNSVTDYAVGLGFKSFEHEFNKFKIEHDRKYESREEEEARKFNFLKTLQYIEKHNHQFKSGEATHEVGVSLFADMTTEEYERTFSMASPMELNITSSPLDSDAIVNYAGLPESFDWRQHGKVSPVKNQGACGACWAFTTVAMIESGYLIHHNQKVILSEQQLVDCLNTNCGGLYIDKALIYVHANGVEAGSDYPYQAHAYACRNNPSKYHARISGYHTLGKSAGRGTAADQEIMTHIMNEGPIGFMLDASGDDFAHYRGGVLTTGLNQWKAVHAMTLVGWGTQNNVPYWIIKNSWGPQWGEAGFLKLARNRDMRGVNEWLYYPTF